MKRLVIAILFLLSMNSVYASVNTQSLTFSTTEYAKLSPQKAKSVASNWGFKRMEYTRYLQLMHNTPNGLYYGDKRLSPSWVLGINARNDQERRHFAKIAILRERVKIAKELKFDQLFSSMQAEMYPNDKMIADTSNTRGARIQLRQGDRLVLFVQQHNAQLTASVFAELVSVATQKNLSLDIFVVGASTNDAVQQWANNHKVPLDLVKAGQITLNFDHGLSAKLNVDTNALPYLGLNHGKVMHQMNVKQLEEAHRA